MMQYTQMPQKDIAELANVASLEIEDDDDDDDNSDREDGACDHGYDRVTQTR